MYARMQLIIYSPFQVYIVRAVNFQSWSTSKTFHNEIDVKIKQSSITKCKICSEDVKKEATESVELERERKNKKKKKQNDSIVTSYIKKKEVEDKLPIPKVEVGLAKCTRSALIIGDMCKTIPKR